MTIDIDEIEMKLKTNVQQRVQGKSKAVFEKKQ